MNTSRLRWLIAGLLLLVANSVAPAEILGQFQQKLTIAEFIKQTDGLIQRVQSLSDNAATAQDLRESLPDHITVSNDSHEYSISYAWLKSDLAELSGANAAKRSRLLKEIEDRLQQTEQQARALALAAPVADNSSSRLTAILARREFRDVHGPTALDRLRDRVLRWLSRLLERIFIGAGSHSQVLQIGGYLLMAIAIGVLALWIKRQFSTPPATATPRQIVPFAPSARHWHSWLSQARQLAAQGDWRGAIHLAYWAAISFVEEGGAWRPDRARTPREYLKLIGRQHHYFSILRDLTRTFELTWYGNQEASAVHFQETLSHLEKLGCR